MLITTIPKSGSHLLLEYLNALLIPSVQCNITAHIATTKQRIERRIPGRRFKFSTPFLGGTSRYLVLKNSISCPTITHALQSHSAPIWGHLGLPPYFQHDVGLQSQIKKRKVILLVRNPWDICLSMAHHATSPKKQHRLNAFFKDLANPVAKVVDGLSADELKTVSGYDGGLNAQDIYKIYPAFVSIKTVLNTYSNWVDTHPTDRLLVLRYEDLVGESRGGVMQTAADTVSKLAQFVDYPIDEQAAVSLVHTCTSTDTSTLNVGQSNRWQRELSAQQIDYVRDRTGNFLTQFYPEFG